VGNRNPAKLDLAAGTQRKRRRIDQASSCSPPTQQTRWPPSMSWPWRSDQPEDQPTSPASASPNATTPIRVLLEVGVRPARHARLALADPFPRPRRAPPAAASAVEARQQPVPGEISTNTTQHGRRRGSHSCEALTGGLMRWGAVGATEVVNRGGSDRHGQLVGQSGLVDLLFPRPQVRSGRGGCSG
jgi:hypothetical protein